MDPVREVSFVSVLTMQNKITLSRWVSFECTETRRVSCL